MPDYKADKLAGEMNRRLPNAIQDGEMWVADAREICDFALHEQDVGKSPGTIEQYVHRLRKLSERSQKPVIEMTEAEFQKAINAFASGRHPDVKDEGITVDPYVTALCRFTSVCDTTENIEWDGSIEFEKTEGRDLSAEDLPYREDVDALLEACGQDLCYKALITWALAAGQRLDAIRTLRLKHIQWDGPAGDLELNEEEGALKGQEGSIPMFWAKHWVREWLHAHPYTDENGEPEDPEAALFTADPRRPIGRGNPGEPLHPTSVQRRIRNLAEDAGIEKEITSHIFRHAAATRLVLKGVDRERIKSIMGWTRAGGQWETYTHLADQLRNDGLREDLDLPTSENGHPPVGEPTLTDCECGERYPPRIQTCPTCGGDVNEMKVFKKQVEKADIEELMDMHDRLYERIRTLEDQQT